MTAEADVAAAAGAFLQRYLQRDKEALPACPEDEGQGEAAAPQALPPPQSLPNDGPGVALRAADTALTPSEPRVAVGPGHNGGGDGGASGGGEEGAHEGGGGGAALSSEPGWWRLQVRPPRVRHMRMWPHVPRA
jgi:hypothetical protein